MIDEVLMEGKFASWNPGSKRQTHPSWRRFEVSSHDREVTLTKVHGNRGGSRGHVADVGVAYSVDGGLSWTVPQNNGLSLNQTPRISFADSSFGLLISHSDPSVYVTTDGGNNWISSENSGGSNQDVVALGNHGWYIPHPADHTFLKYSTNAGLNWTEQLTDPAGFEVLGRSRAGLALWSGTTTGRIYSYPEESPASTPDPALLARNLVCFPNPCGADLQVQWNAGGRSDRVLPFRIFSIGGRLVAQGEAPNGRIRVEGLPTGLYLLDTYDRMSGARRQGRFIRR